MADVNDTVTSKFSKYSWIKLLLMNKVKPVAAQQMFPSAFSQDQKHAKRQHISVRMSTQLANIVVIIVSA